MSEREEMGNVVELLLREPEIVAWLDGKLTRGQAPAVRTNAAPGRESGACPRDGFFDDSEDDDYEPPRAA